MDISKYFSESLGIRDNESRLYLLMFHMPLHIDMCETVKSIILNTDVSETAKSRLLPVGVSETVRSILLPVDMS